MTCIAFSFTTGRYHGTRWGTHVNEAELDWPPSPWRLLRALLAVGYGKLGWSEPPPPLAIELLERLCTVAPNYHLPEGVTESHTRHYMPQYGLGKSSKVFDPFVHLGKDTTLFASWPVELEPQLTSLLDELLAGLSYLGRAESWVEARRVSPDQVHGLRCGVERPDSGAFQRLRLLAPIPQTAYAEWRSDALAQALSDELAARVAAAETKGRRAPDRLSAAQRRRVEANFPADMIAALSIDTGALRKAGWSRPPGSAERVYFRPAAAIERAPAPPLRRPKRGRRAPPTVALYEVSSETVAGEVLPRLARVTACAHRVHQSLAKISDGFACAETLTGRARGGPSKGHLHAHILGLTSSSPSREKLPQAPIERVALWVPGGLDAEAQERLLHLRWLYSRDAPLSLALQGFATPAELADGRAGRDRALRVFHRAQVWRSLTPFFCPRFEKRRGKDSLLGQVQAELARRSLPQAAEVEVERERGFEEGRRAPWWRHVDPRRGEHSPPTVRPYGLRLRFAEPVCGPIALGFASHYGLGLFEPAS